MEAVKKKNKVPISLYVEEEVASAIAEYAESTNNTVSRVAAHLVKIGIKNSKEIEVIMEKHRKNSLGAADIRTRVAKWAHKNNMEIKEAWNKIYDKYKEKTGISPWKGNGSGLENIISQTGGLEGIEAVIRDMETMGM